MSIFWACIIVALIILVAAIMYLIVVTKINQEHMRKRFDVEKMNIYIKHPDKR